MDYMQMMAEQKIREAMENGEMDDLVYAGRPVEFDDMAGVPEELRMTYHILKNAHILPEEMDIRKEILTLEKMIETCTNEDEKKQITARMNEKTLRFNILMERRKSSSSALSQYRDKIAAKLGD